MGMIGTFHSVTDKDLAALIEEPARIHRLMRGGEELLRAGKTSFLGKLFGRETAKMSVGRWAPEAAGETYDVDKAWHGIHYLLTGDIGEGEHALGFILYGGREIAEDMGYGPPRGFSAAEVKEIAAKLNEVDIDRLYAETDPARLREEGIYPDCWDEPKEECIEYLTRGLRDLREFVGKLTAQGRGMVVVIA